MSSCCPGIHFPARPAGRRTDGRRSVAHAHAVKRIAQQGIQILRLCGRLVGRRNQDDDFPLRGAHRGIVVGKRIERTAAKLLESLGQFPRHDGLPKPQYRMHVLQAGRQPPG